MSTFTKLALCLLSFTMGNASELEGLTVLLGVGGNNIHDELAHEAHLGSSLTFSGQVDYVPDRWGFGPSLYVSRGSNKGLDGLRLEQEEVALGVRTYARGDIYFSLGAGVSHIRTEVRDETWLFDRTVRRDFAVYGDVAMLFPFGDNLIAGATSRYSWTDLQHGKSDPNVGSWSFAAVVGWSF